MAIWKDGNSTLNSLWYKHVLMLEKIKKGLKVKKNRWKNTKRFPPFPHAQLLCAISVSPWLFLTAEYLDIPQLAFIFSTTGTNAVEDPALQIAMEAEYPGSQVDWHTMY